MIRFKGSGARILDFDTEARPLSWYGGDWVTKEITAVAGQFIGEKKMHAWVLGPKTTTEEILEGFLKLYEKADIVTGHYIRGYDLPVLNGALLEFGYPALEPKLTQDTKLDLVKFSGLSKSQENLGALLGLEHPKVQMDQAKWREANRLTPAGIRLTRERVTGDVRQHIELRSVLIERGLLGSPKLWSPHPVTSSSYHP
ncbi:MAG TPA: hypothetical protein VE990_12450 [Acidimicrobiales bacterium]|nr:hypothetical protein [Acidimicrobiales bacterium]